MWDLEELVVAKGPREVCGSVMVGRKNPGSEWWYEEIKAGVEKQLK